MSRPKVLLSIVAILLVVRTAAAQTAPAVKPAAAIARAVPEAIDKAIRASAAAFEKSFNAGDAKAVAAQWTEDGDFSDASGDTTRGRAAIEKRYAEFFAANAGATIDIAIDDLRALNADTVLEDGHVTVTLPAGSANTTRYSAVHVKQDGKWLIACVRDIPSAAGAEATPEGDLDWLVGRWSAEHEGTTVEVDCQWAAGRAFLEARYTIQKGEAPPTTNVQIIGRDPVTGRVGTWMFSSDGGRAEGLSSPSPSGWTIELFGVTAEGAPTTAVNHLSRVDDALVWQSTQRTIGGVSLPDLNEIVLKRTKASP